MQGWSGESPGSLEAVGRGRVRGLARVDVGPEIVAGDARGGFEAQNELAGEQPIPAEPIRQVLLLRSGSSLSGSLTTELLDAPPEGLVAALMLSPSHTTELPPGCNAYNPVVAASHDLFSYIGAMGADILSAAWVRETRTARGWSAAEAARRTVHIAEIQGYDFQLSQQAFSKFETGKGKSIPKWVSLYKQALWYADASVEQKASFVKPLTDVLPIKIADERMQVIELYVALPGHADLREMFQGMLDSMPSVPRDALAHELAKLLPTSLYKARSRIVEWKQAPNGEVQEPAAAHATEDRALQPARRT